MPLPVCLQYCSLTPTSRSCSRRRTAARRRRSGFGETFLDDDRTEGAYLEVLPDGTGSFDLGELHGTFHVARGLRATWVGGFVYEPMTGTIELSPSSNGLVLARIKVRGEDPWDVEAWSPGASAEPSS